jgi:hypothetical protein
VLPFRFLVATPHFFAFFFPYRLQRNELYYVNQATQKTNLLNQLCRTSDLSKQQDIRVCSPPPLYAGSWLSDLPWFQPPGSRLTVFPYTPGRFVCP